MIPREGVQIFLSLTQPWATLMAFGFKGVETRGWRTKFRGWFAIHASKGFPRECRMLCLQQPFLGALASAGIRDVGDLPTGKVLAVTRLNACEDTLVLRHQLPPLELAFGDYSVGRYGFVTEGVRRLRGPFDLRGLQRFQRLPTPILEEDLEPAHG